MTYEISFEAAEAISALKECYSNYEIICLISEETVVNSEDKYSKEVIVLRSEFSSTLKSSPNSRDSLMDILVNDTYKIKKEKTKREKVQEALCKYYGFGVGESILKQIDQIYGVNSDGTDQY